MKTSRVEDALLPELLVQLRKLLDSTRQWAQRLEVPADCEMARRRAILINHRRYLRRVPAYRQLAEREGISNDVDLSTIVNTLAFPSDLFKSYKREWLEGRDFASMTSWLRTVFTQDIEVDTDGIEGVGAWVRKLQAQKVFVTCSSGTSGRFSFVPRDFLTFQAMRTNGSYYHHSVWSRDESGRYPEFDCLVLGSRGTDMGIQGAGTGIAQMARRSHFLLEGEMTADTMLGAGDGDSPGSGAPRDLFARSFEFLRETIADNRRVLLFGAPFQAKALCDRVAAEFGAFPLPADSILVSGGGWKSFTGQSIPQEELRRLIEATLGIPPTRVIDTYSSAELNCVLMSCAAGRYHIPPLLEPVVLDEALTGEPHQEGTGTLAFLDPFALSYPGFLISGDNGSLTREPCRCGLRGWSIAGEIRRARNQEIKGCGAVMASITA